MLVALGRWAAEKARPGLLVVFSLRLYELALKACDRTRSAKAECGPVPSLVYLRPGDLGALGRAEGGSDVLVLTHICLAGTCAPAGTRKTRKAGPRRRLG